MTLLAALGALDRDLYCIVEQDMYPCDFDTPLPIAIRTQRVLQGLRPDRRPAARLIRADRPPASHHATNRKDRTMTIRVGIIGTGLIGEDHGRKLVNVINGSTVGAVTDVNRARAEEVADEPSAARPSSTPAIDLIDSDKVDAVLVTSIGPTHAEFVLACIAAGKPVMCEKPLAPTVAECERSSRPRSPSGSGS